MAGIDTSKRDLAVRRGLAFIHNTACDPENFRLYGHDYLSCFSGISSTSCDSGLRRIALSLGRERAHQWRREHSEVPANVDADDVAQLIFGNDAADRLGLRDDTLKKQLRKIAGDFTANDYFCFDPATEPPPKDVPEDCDCGAYNPRGRRSCKRCRNPLSMNSSYWVWLHALTLSYTAERCGIEIGTTFADVIKWLATMNNYPDYENGKNPDFFWAIYAVTHVVYTLNDYSSYKLSPSWLPHEYAFLRKNLKQAVLMEDPETIGEFLDTLKSFGLTEDHPLILKGLNYLLSQQNSDGSWGDLEAEDIYQRYHPTWTAIDGLREYSWRGERLSFNRLRPLLASVQRDRCGVVTQRISPNTAG